MTRRPTNTRATVRAYLQAHPGRRFTAVDIAESTDDETVTPRTAGQAIGYMMKAEYPGLQRVGYGKYVYTPNGVAPVDVEALQPLLDAIPEDVFEDVGMVVLGRAADGDFITRDEQGTLWRVTVSVEARAL